MQSFLLVALALVATVVSAAPLDARSTKSLTCAGSMSGMSTMTCHCLATCASTDRCCSDYSDFARGASAFVKKADLAIAAAGAGMPLPAFHKRDVAVTGVVASNIGNGMTLLKVKDCLFEDTLHLSPSSGGMTILPMPKWEMRTCAPGYDVIARTAAGEFVSFESAVKVPKSVKVAVGALPPAPGTKVTMQYPHPWDIMYYAELKDSAASAAYKAALVMGDEHDATNSGFTATLHKTASGAAAFDATTPARKWKLDSATFSTASVFAAAIPENDVSPAQLDADFKTFASMAGFKVTPTTHGKLRRVMTPAGKWVDLFAADFTRSNVAKQLLA